MQGKGRPSRIRKGRLLEQAQFSAVDDMLFLNFNSKPIRQIGDWDDHEAHGSPVIKEYNNGFCLMQASNWKHDGPDLALYLNGRLIFTSEAKNLNKRFKTCQDWWNHNVQDRLRQSKGKRLAIFSSFKPCKGLNTNGTDIIEVGFQVLKDGAMTAQSVLWAKEILMRKLLPVLQDAILTAKREKILTEDPSLDIHYDLTLPTDIDDAIKIQSSYDGSEWFCLSSVVMRVGEDYSGCVLRDIEGVYGVEAMKNNHIIRFPSGFMNYWHMMISEVSPLRHFPLREYAVDYSAMIPVSPSFIWGSKG